MAPRKASKGSKSSTPAKKRVAANGFKLPDPVPAGIVMRDVARKEWVLGKSIGELAMYLMHCLYLKCN